MPDVANSRMMSHASNSNCSAASSSESESESRSGLAIAVKVLLHAKNHHTPKLVEKNMSTYDKILV